MKSSHSKRKGNVIGAILGLAALTVFLGFGSVYAGELLVYTALEDDELAVYIKEKVAGSPDDFKINPRTALEDFRARAEKLKACE